MAHSHSHGIQLTCIVPTFKRVQKRSAIMKRHVRAGLYILGSDHITVEPDHLDEAAPLKTRRIRP